MTAPLFAPGTPVVIAHPAGRVTVGTTRMTYRVTTGTYLTRPAYEHTMSRVRVGGMVVTVSDEYLTLDGSLQ